jgi:transposase
LFNRSESRVVFTQYIEGLLAEQPKNNGRALSERARQATAAQAQHTALTGVGHRRTDRRRPGNANPGPGRPAGRIDRPIRDTFRTHPQAEITESLPGMGPILGAEFVVAAADLTAYADAGHLASAAGLVPVPRD